jgi:hypothetical protein
MLGTRWQIVDIPLFPEPKNLEEGENLGPHRTHMLSHNQYVTKLSLNPQIKKQETT